jgi:hypothetical protein
MRALRGERKKSLGWRTDGLFNPCRDNRSKWPYKQMAEREKFLMKVTPARCVSPKREERHTKRINLLFSPIINSGRRQCCDLIASQKVGESSQISGWALMAVSAWAIHCQLLSTNNSIIILFICSGPHVNSNICIWLVPKWQNNTCVRHQHPAAETAQKRLCISM